MRREPSAQDLLETARALLREAVVPRLQGTARYEALMVANAIAIAARQLAAGDRSVRAAYDRLVALYDAAGLAPVDLEWQLARDVRGGVFDAPSPRRSAVFAHLCETARAAAEESHPKALSDRAAGD